MKNCSNRNCVLIHGHAHPHNASTILHLTIFEWKTIQLFFLQLTTLPEEGLISLIPLLPTITLIDSPCCYWASLKISFIVLKKTSLKYFDNPQLTIKALYLLFKDYLHTTTTKKKHTYMLLFVYIKYKRQLKMGYPHCLKKFKNFDFSIRLPKTDFCA